MPESARKQSYPKGPWANKQMYKGTDRHTNCDKQT